MLYRSSSAASDVDLARFDLRIIRAMQSSGRPRPHGWVRGIAQARSATPPKTGLRECNPGHRWAATIGVIQMWPERS